MTVLAILIAAVLATAIAYRLGRAHTPSPAPTTAPEADTTAAPAPGVPRVTVQVTDGRSPCRTVQAVAEISDGHLTVRATATKDTSPGGSHLGYSYPPVLTNGAAHTATQNAISTARDLLRGAQAGYAAEATAHAARVAAEQAAAQQDATADRAGIEQTTTKAGA